MNLHFLWRENYVSYLWARNVTAKSYFLENGILLYDREVLSAYATKKELDAVKKLANYLIKNPKDILILKKKFNAIRLRVCQLKRKFLKQVLARNTNKELYSSLLDMIDVLKEQISVYRYTEPHYVKHIEKAVTDMMRKKISVNQNSEKILAKLLAKQDKKFWTKYRLTQKEIVFFNLFNEVSHIRFEAKKIETSMIDFSEKILREIAKRTYLAVNQVSNLTKRELKTLLDNNLDLNLKMINKRNQGFALLIDMTSKNKILDLSKHKREWLLRHEQNQSNAIFLRGSIAYPGKVSGTVRIAPLMSKSSEYQKYIRTLKKTDVLVSSMTSPNLTPAFSRVAAVITDEGGLMSHAALVAREKKIPCIIGTKIATKMFCEGGWVFVDADQGIIKKL